MTAADSPEWLAIPEPWEITGNEPEAPDKCGCDMHREVVYTLHFDPPYKPYPDAPRYKWAGHYTGKARESRLETRLAEHAAGQGARITQVQIQSGGSWRLAKVEPGGHEREAQLKQHGAARRCPICKAEAGTDAPGAGPPQHAEPGTDPGRELQPEMIPAPSQEPVNGGPEVASLADALIAGWSPKPEANAPEQETEMELEAG
jgi:hypothetical protein